MLLSLEHDDYVLDAFWSSDGSQIVTMTQDGVLRLWDAETGTMDLLLVHSHGLPAGECDLSLDVLPFFGWINGGTHFVTWQQACAARVW
ncbi:MAG: hypothetical protein JW910_17020, partial [Anaerolineae bacterium]|nr:hypothetical protein [Anaerolineae bacterium]